MTLDSIKKFQIFADQNYDYVRFCVFQFDFKRVFI